MLYKFSFALLVFALGVSPLMGQSRAKDSAVMGGVAGAIIGGIAGHQNDETPEGIAIGGAVGAIAGGLLGRAQDQQMMRDYNTQQYQYQQRRQEVSQAVSIGDAVALSRSGLSPNLIVNQIRTNGVQQKIGVQEIIMLHDNGVPEIVIQEMQRARIAGTAPAQVTYVQPRPTVVVERQPSIIVESYPSHHGHIYHAPPRQSRHHYHWDHH